MKDIALCDDVRQKLSASPLGKELLHIFDNESIQTHFQPIVNLKERSIYAFESLTRGPENSQLYSPINLFSLASDYDCLLELDVMARNVAINNFVSAESFHQNKAKLFINVTVSTLLNKKHQTGRTLEYLADSDLDLSQVVIEITELQPVDDCDMFLKAINHYRKMGFRVAIDDLGSGYNGLKLWSEVKPEYVKIDKHFISDIDSNADKYRFMETILTLAKGLGTKIIAEGVETEQELKLLEKLGVDFVQGYLLKKPSPLPALSLNYHWPDSIEKLSDPAETVQLLSRTYKVMEPSTSVQDMAEFLLDEPRIEFVPIVKNGMAQGIVWRRDLMDLLASKFGRDLHLRKEVQKFMDKTPLIYDVNTPLVDASRDITEKGVHERGAFIITERGRYIGCGTFMDLLKVMTDLKVRSAQYANPLSGLPGNVPIQNRIQECLDRKIAFTVIYVDVDNFKPYNDFYSFEQGDQVISAIAQVLEEAMSGREGFIGHVGGDDFVIVTKEDPTQICELILKDFQQTAQKFYTQEDRERGGIYEVNREGQKTFYPIMSLSLGVLLVYPGIFEHTQKLSSVATKAKKGAKSAGGNQYFVIDSRSDGQTSSSFEVVNVAVN